MYKIEINNGDKVETVSLPREKYINILEHMSIMGVTITETYPLLKKLCSVNVVSEDLPVDGSREEDIIGKLSSIFYTVGVNSYDGIYMLYTIWDARTKQAEELKIQMN